MTPGYVAVRMRDEESVARPFTEWPLDNLDELLTIIRVWRNHLDLDPTGQFCCDDAGNWYFEVVMCCG